VKISKTAVGIVFGMCGVAISAQADTFNPNFSVVEVHSTGGGNTAGSFAASAMMGGKGDSNLGLFLDWESSVISMCASQSGSTNWPGSCSPTKMAAVLGGLTNEPWSQLTWPSANQSDALNQTVNALRLFGSPVLVPIFGQADHWSTITQVTATLNGSTWTISNVKSFDGGPVGDVDSSGNLYVGGLRSFSGSVWKNVYTTTQIINPFCDPCTTDPWYNRYVAVFDPPPGQEHASIVTDFVKAPGVAQGGMTEARARALVWNALAAAGIDRDPDIWNAIRGGAAGAAVEVNGLWPAGGRWDYFLVPILSGAHTATAFVQLAADDGAFEGVHVLSAPGHFDPVTEVRAEQLARAALQKGESLTPGILTWDPRSNTTLAKAPTFPYYEFGVIAADKAVGVVRVSFHQGTVVRSAP